MTFAWFHKHQKVLLTAVTLFVLLTFSVTGAIYGIFNPRDDQDAVLGSFVLNSGRKVEVTQKEFYSTMQRVGRIHGIFSQGAETTNRDVWMHLMLYNQAVEAGVMVSDAELRDLLGQYFRGLSQEQYLEFLQRNGMTAKQFEETFRDILTTDKFRLLDYFGDFVTDKEVYDRFVGGGNRKFEVEYVAFPWDRYKDSMPADVSDEELQAFYDEMSAIDKTDYKLDDRASFEVAYLPYADADPAKLDAVLGETPPSDTEIQDYYTEHQARYKATASGSGEQKQEGDGGSQDDKKSQEGDKDEKKSETGDGHDPQVPPASDEAGAQDESKAPQNDPAQQPEEKPADQEKAQPQDGEKQSGEGEDTPEKSNPKSSNEGQGDDQTPASLFKPLEEVRDHVVREIRVDRARQKLVEAMRAEGNDKSFKELAEQYGFHFLEQTDPVTRDEANQKLEEAGLGELKVAITNAVFSPNAELGRVATSPPGNNDQVVLVRPSAVERDRFKTLADVHDQILEKYVEKKTREAAEVAANEFLDALIAKLENGEYSEQMKNLRESSNATVERRLSEEMKVLEDQRKQLETEQDEAKKQEELAKIDEQIAEKQTSIREEEKKNLRRLVTNLLSLPAGNLFADVAKEQAVEVQKLPEFNSTFSLRPSWTHLADGPMKYITGPKFRPTLEKLRNNDAPPEEQDTAQPGAVTFDPQSDYAGKQTYVVHLVESEPMAPSEMTPSDYENARSMREFIMRNIEGNQKWGWDFVTRNFEFALAPGVDMDLKPKDQSRRGPQ